MSIWGVWASAGKDLDPDSTGTVLKNLENNWYPEADRWPAGDVAVSGMSPWCVSGHEDERDDYPTTGPWMRLDVSDGTDYVSVVLDEQAVVELVLGIRAWLDAPKVYPKGDR